MVLTMLGIGVSMVASLANYHTLVSMHRPLEHRELVEFLHDDLKVGAFPWALACGD